MTKPYQTDRSLYTEMRFFFFSGCPDFGDFFFSRFLFWSKPLWQSWWHRWHIVRLQRDAFWDAVPALFDKFTSSSLAEHRLAATKEEQLEEKKIEKKPKLAPCLQMFQCRRQEAEGPHIWCIWDPVNQRFATSTFEEEKLHLNKVRVRQILIRFWSGCLAAKTQL